MLRIRSLAGNGVAFVLLVLLPACGGGKSAESILADDFLATTRSTPIAVSPDGTRVFSVNPDADSVSVFDVQGDANTRIAEVAVGQHPTSVAFDGGKRAYVTNFIGGDVTVIDIDTLAVVATIPNVGAGPYGAASSPNGTEIYLTFPLAGEMAQLDTVTFTITNRVKPPGARDLRAVAVTNDGDSDDTDETVIVTEFLAQQIPGAPGEGFDDTKEGRVYLIPAAGGPGTTLRLGPQPTGFTADRQSFCVSNGAANDTFCGGPDEPTVAFPNLLHGLALAGSRLLVPSLGVSPKPPIAFDTNFQAFLATIDLTGPTLVGVRNLNADARDEPPNPIDPLNGVFFSLPWAMDVHPKENRAYLVVSGIDQVVRIDGVRTGTPSPATRPDGTLVRIPVGRNPQGIAIHPAGSRAYVSNHVGRTVSVLDLTTDSPLATMSSSALPLPGTPEAQVHLGLELFNSALGPPAPGPSADGRDVHFTMSDNGWGSCFNCHPFGLADGVTWVFPSGPRQTTSLDGTFAPGGTAQRVLGWSGVRSSVQDFEKNVEEVTGGFGLIGANGPGDGVVDHGANRGLDPRADAIEAYVRSIRTPPAVPDGASEVVAGRAVFAAVGCAACHGGPGWSRSQVTYALPAALDPDVVLLDGQVLSVGGQPVLRDVGTFDPSSPIEVRGGGPQAGATALGAAGYNPPSLLGTGYRSRYFHDGRYATLEEVAASGHGGFPSTTPDQANLIRFLRSIDDTTTPFP